MNNRSRQWSRIGGVALLGVLLVSCSLFRSGKTTKVERDRIEMFAPHQVQDKIRAHQDSFRTMKARTKIRADLPDSRKSFTAHLRLAIDSVIWMSVSGPFATEMARLILTPDSVKLMDRTKNKVYLKDLSFIKKKLAMPLQFKDVQSLLTGQCVFCHNKTPRYDRDTFATDSQRYFLLHYNNRDFNNRFWVNSTDFLPHKLELQHQVINQSFQALYQNHKQHQGVSIPMENHYTISARKETNIRLRYKSVSVNDSLKFPFHIPDSYEKVF